MPPAGTALASALLERGADANARNAFGQIPLHNAASGLGDNDAMISLLEAGADVNARVTGAAVLFRMEGSGAHIEPEERGATPLHMAARRGRTARCRVWKR